MAFGRPWRALFGWVGHLVGRDRQTWVEPSNAITRAVLSGATVSLPDFPVRSAPVWSEMADSLATPGGVPAASEEVEVHAPAMPGGAEPPAPAAEPGTEEQKPPGRWRAA